MLRQRNTRIDVLKGLLVIGMIISHINTNWNVRVSYVSLAVNLVAFSGFMFCFGFVTQLAYFSKPEIKYRRIFPSIYRPLIAFYISGIFISTIQAHHTLGLSQYINILTLSTLPSNSEFLPAFSLMILVAVLLVKPLRWILESRLRFFVTCFLLLLTTFFPYDLVKSVQVALFVGAPTSISIAFPVLQYGIFFLLGMYFARYEIGDTIYVKLIGTLGVIVLISIISHVRPERFPPSIGWILAGIPLVFLMYWVAGKVDKVGLLRRILIQIGENTLLFLVLSNVMIFGINGSLQATMSIPQAIVLTIFIIASSYFLVSIVRQTKSPTLKTSGGS